MNKHPGSAYFPNASEIDVYSKQQAEAGKPVFSLTALPSGNLFSTPPSWPNICTGQLKPPTSTTTQCSFLSGKVHTTYL